MSYQALKRLQGSWMAKAVGGYLYLWQGLLAPQWQKTLGSFCFLFLP